MDDLRRLETPLTSQEFDDECGGDAPCWANQFAAELGLEEDEPAPHRSEMVERSSDHPEPTDSPEVGHSLPSHVTGESE